MSDDCEDVGEKTLNTSEEVGDSTVQATEKSSQKGVSRKPADEVVDGFDDSLAGVERSEQLTLNRGMMR